MHANDAMMLIIQQQTGTDALTEALNIVKAPIAIGTNRDEIRNLVQKPHTHLLDSISLIHYRSHARLGVVNLGSVRSSHGNPTTSFRSPRGTTRKSGISLRIECVTPSHLEEH
jgi:hypothetical protein